MARPRVFLSSTFYDLKHIRTDLNRFIVDLGYETIRNEKGDIPYGTEMKLEEYCYNTVKDVDILVGIVGGRYGGDSKDSDHSITQLEIKTAHEQNKQVYIFIEKNVLTEYRTYLLNKPNIIKLSYADNVKIYEFIDQISNIKAGFIIQPFEHIYEITDFLKSQWAGLFRDFLRQKSETKLLTNLSAKVDDLGAVTETLKTYIENSLPKLIEDTAKAQDMIESENKKITQIKIDNKLLTIDYMEHLMIHHDIPMNLIIDALKRFDTLTELCEYFAQITRVEAPMVCLNKENIKQINLARTVMGLNKYIDIDMTPILELTTQISRERNFEESMDEG